MSSRCPRSRRALSGRPSRCPHRLRTDWVYGSGAERPTRPPMGSQLGSQRQRTSANTHEHFRPEIPPGFNDSERRRTSANATHVHDAQGVGGSNPSRPTPRSLGRTGSLAPTAIRGDGGEPIGRQHAATDSHGSILRRVPTRPPPPHPPLFDGLTISPTPGPCHRRSRWSDRGTDLRASRDRVLPHR